MRSASARAPSGSMHEIVVPELKRGTPFRPLALPLRLEVR